MPMMFRICQDCGVMLPDDDEYARKHAEWHRRLVDLFAALTMNPEGLKEALARLARN